jgi:Zn-finger nucleic acid-binding protein
MPKCQAPMNPIERSGVTIDRCTECGGVFLDRGELERLETAEAPGLTGTRPAADPANAPPARQAGRPSSVSYSTLPANTVAQAGAAATDDTAPATARSRRFAALDAARPAGNRAAGIRA